MKPVHYKWVRLWERTETCTWCRKIWNVRFCMETSTSQGIQLYFRARAHTHTNIHSHTSLYSGKRNALTQQSGKKRQTCSFVMSQSLESFWFCSKHNLNLLTKHKSINIEVRIFFPADGWYMFLWPNWSCNLLHCNDVHESPENIWRPFPTIYAYTGALGTRILIYIFNRVNFN